MVELVVKRKHLLLLIAVVSVSVLSCNVGINGNGGTEVYVSSGYIGAYYSPHSLVLKKFHTEDEGYFFGVLSRNEKVYSIFGNDENRSKYEALRNYFGDTAYVREFTYNENLHNTPLAYLSNEIKSIVIRSTHDFMGCPAGDTLNKMFSIYAISLDSYIQSGYQDVYDYSNPLTPIVCKELVDEETQYNPEYIGAPVYGKLSEIEYSKLRLIAANYVPSFAKLFLLKFDSEPTLKQGELSVEIEFVDGTRLEASSALVDLFW